VHSATVVVQIASVFKWFRAIGHPFSAAGVALLQSTRPLVKAPNIPLRKAG